MTEPDMTVPDLPREAKKVICAKPRFRTSAMRNDHATLGQNFLVLWFWTLAGLVLPVPGGSPLSQKTSVSERASERASE